MLKKYVSLFLSCLLVFVLVPVHGVFADEAVIDDAIVSEEEKFVNDDVSYDWAEMIEENMTELLYRGSVYQFETLTTSAALKWYLEGHEYEDTYISSGGSLHISDFETAEEIVVFVTNNDDFTFDLVAVPVFQIHYDLVLGSEVGGHIEGAESGSYRQGFVLELRAIPDPGYRFDRWIVDDELMSADIGPEVTYMMPYYDSTVVARFVRLPSYEYHPSYTYTPALSPVPTPAKTSETVKANGLEGITSDNISTKDDGTKVLKNDTTVVFSNGVSVDVPSNSEVKEAYIVVPIDDVATAYIPNSKTTIKLVGGTAIYDSQVVTGGNGSIVTLGSGVKAIVPKSSLILTDALSIKASGEYTIVSRDGKEKSISKDFNFVEDRNTLYGYRLDWTKSPKDVSPTSPYYNDIKEVYLNKIMAGVSDDEFGASLPTSRGMLAAIIGRIALQSNTGINLSAVSNYGDMSGNEYYAPYVAWGSSVGVLSGVENNTFAPNANITREDLAVILYRYIQLINIDLPVISDDVNFADASNISGYAYEAVSSLQKAGILAGRTGNIVDPKATVTRAELATIVKRLIGAIGL